MGSLTAPFTVLRLLTPLKISYEAAKKRAEPYTKIVEELPQMNKRGGAIGSTGCQRKLSHVCTGQQSG